MRLARYSMLSSILRSEIRNLRMCRGQKVKNKVEVAAKSRALGYPPLDNARHRWNFVESRRVKI